MLKIKTEENKNKIINVNRKILKRFSFKTLNFILFFIIIISGGFYVLEANNLTATGFALNELKLKLNQNNDVNTYLESRITFLSSYNNISKKIQDMNLVKADNVNYITEGASAVAKK